MNMPPETDNKVGLVIAAHPDDPDFGAGGTAALWTTLGWEMHYLVVTNGAKGTADPEMTSERLVPMREVEQRNAADALGVLSCTFLGGEDGELEYTANTWAASSGQSARFNRMRSSPIRPTSSTAARWRRPGRPALGVARVHQSPRPSLHR